MTWIAAIVGIIVAGGGIAYLTGYDDVIYRTVMNFGAAIFLYVLTKVMELFCWLLDALPPLPNASQYGNAITNFLTILARANTFFPVVEFAFLFSFTIGFLLIFITVKFILKLIPTIG
jgi:hypothetical protein